MGGNRDGQKKPKAKFTGGAGKHPAAAGATATPRVPQSLPGGPSDESPSWRFSWLDRGGEWGWDEVTAEDLALVHTMMVNFETMRMGEILGAQKQSKSIPTENLPAAALSRLSQIGRDDETGLVELRLGGAQRLWGLRRDSLIYVLWWDPDHTVFPSRK